MLITAKHDIYTAFGYSIQSDIPLPELKKLGSATCTADIFIRYADLSNNRIRLSELPKKVSVTEDRIMFWVPDLAIFAVDGGTSITISPEQNADEDKIRLYVLGTCMGAVLLQRRVLPLHGSAIVIDNKAYAFVGHSGHGKSTLASAFLHRGFHLLTDDVIAVTLDHRNIPYVTPSYPQQKLWQESLDAFGMRSDRYRPLFERETKFAIPVDSRFSASAFPLAGIFELMKTECSHAEIRPVGKLERLPLLHRHTYRNFFLPNSGLTTWHFETTARLAGVTDFYQLRRPLHGQTVHQLASMILHTIKG